MVKPVNCAVVQSTVPVERRRHVRPARPQKLVGPRELVTRGLHTRRAMKPRPQHQSALRAVPVS